MNVLYYIAAAWVVLVTGVQAAKLPKSDEDTTAVDRAISFFMSVGIALLLFLAGRAA